ncbi:MAG: hypothetical protein NTY63_01415 [Candidatus Bipolaricaulota bacterium]|nr:hypothetical protein [Candidatus Bipolaricaulota bacterium]
MSLRLCRLLLVCAILGFPAAMACSAATGNYLGQKPPGLTPIPLAPSLLTAFSYGGTFNPDLTAFWFTEQAIKGRDGQIVGYAFVDGAWTRLETVPFTPAGMAIEPHIAPSGDRLYFTAGSSAAWKAYVSELTPLGWSLATPLPAPINVVDYAPMYFSSTRDGTLYWTLLTDFEAAIVRTRKAANANGRPAANANGGPTETANGGPTETGYCPVEYMASDGVPWVGAHPFVAPDESFVIFDVRPGGNPRWPDLVVTFRRADGTWTLPQPIAAVNGYATDEMCASVSPDGKYLFFARDLHIWWVSAAVLDPLRP